MIAQYRMAVERMTRLVETWAPEQQQRIFVHHLVLGDLNLPEWVRFFYLHDRHYAHEIEVRERWLKQKTQKVPQKTQKGPQNTQKTLKTQKGKGPQGEKGGKGRRRQARSGRKR